MKQPKRLEHGYVAKYAKVPATDKCLKCGGKLEDPVPRHFDFHQNCKRCWFDNSVPPVTQSTQT